MSRALVRACGPELNSSLATHVAESGELDWGSVHVTPAFGLAAQHRYILHVRAPTLHRRYDHINNSFTSLLALTYANLLRTGFAQLDLHSIGTPLISTGLAGVPVDESLAELIEAMKSVSNELNDNVERTVYVINNERQTVEYLKDLVDVTLDTMNEQSNPVKDQPDASNNCDQSFQAGCFFNI